MKTLWLRLLERIENRAKWVNRAAALEGKGGWTVGRTDMMGYNGEGRRNHYAYPPGDLGHQWHRRKEFTGLRCLARAVKFAERRNADKRHYEVWGIFKG